MDCQQEQLQELEILTCIYMDDLEVLSESPFKFQIKLHYDEKMEKKVPLTIQFPEKYPTEAFTLSIQPTNLLSEDDIKEILNLAKKYNLDNIGIPVVFDTLSLIQDKIYHFATAKSNEEKLKVEIEQIQLSENDDSTDVIQPKVIKCDDKINGTEVTPDSFCKWKIDFELEHNIDYKKSPNDGKFDSLKLTGRQFFERGMDDNATYLEIDGEIIELDDNLYVENFNDVS